MSVPLATSPARGSFGPQLSLSYDSGSGNGPFGFGWSLSLPSITRKTDKGLPHYRDAKDSDVFILSGAEDLVPVFRTNAGGDWVRDLNGDFVIHQDQRDGYLVRRYRPRVEGLFARIERWTRESDGDVHWRSISRDNITTLYGTTSDSRVAEQGVVGPRIFTWLICASYDDKGNALVYEYQRENSERVFEDAKGGPVLLAHERNRSPNARAANTYLKRIKYGNLVANRDAQWKATDPTQLGGWLFEVVFDYDEGHYEELPVDLDGRRFVRAATAATRSWSTRQDRFSTYRAGFEVRTYRLCRRMLMFHHFSNELGTPDYLVRSTDFSYRESPIGSFMGSVTQSGYVRQLDGTYLRRSLPALAFGYSAARIQADVHELSQKSFQNLPAGVDGTRYQWVDLNGEGLSGVLTEDAAGGWFYKRNLSANHLVRDNGSERIAARLGALERVASRPASSLASGGQFLDLAGDGHVDLVDFQRAAPGFYERVADDWLPFRPFVSWPSLDTEDRNLKFVDLDGDGHADVLITDDEVLTWHVSLGEDGFGPAQTVRKPRNDEDGPRVVFADGTESIYLADMSGDGLTDIVRIRNGEVGYFPNLGYGRFGAKVTMDGAPWFDDPQTFKQERLRLADIDGSGTTDLLYLGRNGIDAYRNHAGNSWSRAERLPGLPGIDNVTTVSASDLLGNGTACLVWSSPLAAHSRTPMRYIDLMGGQKPHLLVSVDNNLGAETRITYAPSTKFFLNDRDAGRPWVTRLPFPVHVVEQVETYDRISRNRFVTRYVYHHGHFDGVEREFRGFGMVEQWDTEAFKTLSQSDHFPIGDNFDATSHVPPVVTKTWFHTGTYLGRRVSDFYAGLLDGSDTGEYYREPGLTDNEARELLLDDTVMPDALTADEEGEACRALKGLMLRQEIYALDGTDRAARPYVVTEQNFTIRPLQPRARQRHGVFMTHARESISYHYERALVPVVGGQIVSDTTAAAAPSVKWVPDPRVAHTLTLEVDDFGNALKTASVAYGRRTPDSRLPSERDRETQKRSLVTYTENLMTEAIGGADDHRTPLPAETRTYHLTGYTPTGASGRFVFADLVRRANVPSEGLVHVYDDEIDYEEDATVGKQRRLIEQVRTSYRPDDLGAAANDPLALLALRKVGPLALPGETFKLAFTPGLLAKVYRRPRVGAADEDLIATPDNVLGGQGGDRGGYRSSQALKAAGVFPASDSDDHWWIPSGRVFYSARSIDTPAEELANARAHFFLSRRYRDPFHSDALATETRVTYDAYDLLMQQTQDALGNLVTVGERDSAQALTAQGNDYRVLQPSIVTDSNGNRMKALFDALGLVVATAVMGKAAPVEGDSLEGSVPDLSDAVVVAHMDDPLAAPEALLAHASTRLIYDLNAYARTKGTADPQPTVVYTVARESHDSDSVPAGIKFQHAFSYSDGFGREIQKKVRVEPGPVPRRDVAGAIVVGPDGQPDMTEADAPRRWVGSGWTVFNNKGKPVRQYEPFFSDTHRFDFEARIGVSPILLYDPVDRVVATIHPNHAWEKVVFGPWQQDAWDVNDTVTFEPQGSDLRGFFFHANGSPRLPASTYLPTWHAFRTAPASAAAAARRWPDERTRNAETRAARKSETHASTPTVAHLDALGRAFLTVAHLKLLYSDVPPVVVAPDGRYGTRVVLDIKSNEREVIDAKGRLAVRYDHDMLGNRIRLASMEAGTRWMLSDVIGKPLYYWDSRGHRLRTAYDRVRRQTQSYLREGAAAEVLVAETTYGEAWPQAELKNLRGKVVVISDQAGRVTSDTYDFKGNLKRTKRELATEYKSTVNWSAAPTLEATGYASRTSYDALNRPTQQVLPDGTIVELAYNEAGLLERIRTNLRGAQDAAGEPVWTPMVRDIDYDAKGQRSLIEHGNGVSIRYAYDPLTFRLSRLVTMRDAVRFPQDCPDPVQAGWPGCHIQDLQYTYDAVGNVTNIRDDAQQTVFFRNKRVEPSADYTYDALYRLIEATGREHLGQTREPIPHRYNDVERAGILLSENDGNAMGRYTERYVYDAVGNFLAVAHPGTDPVKPGWTRTYTYDDSSQLEAGVKNNRLSSTTVNDEPPEVHSVGGDGYDAHGNLLRMPQLQVMEWDFKDQLRMSQRQAVNAADGDGRQRQGERTWYVYDANGQRIRKVSELASGQVKDERVYLGAFEIYRSRGLNALVRETLHVMDDKHRIALVETRTDTAPQEQIVRYQFGNHLSSSSLELDDQGQIISYEEYTPYGSTSCQAVRSQTETPKRFRHSGKERDEETGLYYHGARYRTAELGRWVSSDPAGVLDGANTYIYARANPIRYEDRRGYQSDQPKVLGLGLSVFPEGIRPLDALASQAEANVPGRVGIDIRQMPSFAESFETNFGSGAPGGQRDVIRFGAEQAAKWEKFKGIGSAVVVQEALEGKAGVGAIYFDVRGVDPLRPGHTGSELRSVLSSVSAGTNQVDVHIHSEQGISVIRKGGGGISGATLPSALADHVGPALRGAQLVASETAAAGQTLVQRVVGTARGLAGAAKNTLLSQVPGWDEVKAVGGGSVLAGARLMTSYAKQQLGTLVRSAGSLASSVGTALTSEVAAGPVATAGVTGAAVVAAVGSLALAGATVHAAATGQDTPIDVADKFYGTHFGDIHGWVTGKYTK